MYKYYCKKCRSTSLHTEVKGNNTGLYCDDCGAWQCWLGKDELRAFEYSQKSQLPKTSCDIPMPKVVEWRKPKTIARIKLCGGAMTFTVTDYMSWKKPTEEQIKNLHDMLCIDIEILEDGE